METLLDTESLKKYTPEQQQHILAGIRQQAAIASAQNIITVSTSPSTTPTLASGKGEWRIVIGSVCHSGSAGEPTRAGQSYLGRNGRSKAITGVFKNYPSVGIPC